MIFWYFWHGTAASSAYGELVQQLAAECGSCAARADPRRPVASVIHSKARIIKAIIKIIQHHST